MFQQIVKCALCFMAATYMVATCKTLMLATSPAGGSQEYVLVMESERKPVIYPTLLGSDTPMPFSKATPTLSRVVGAARMYYAVYPGASVRDSKFKSYWR